MITLRSIRIISISILAIGIIAAKSALAEIPPADVAAPKLGKDGKIDPHFKEMHESFIRRGQEAPVGLLFLGDSITEGWHWGNNWKIFRDHFYKYTPANFGVGGDHTEHVLWRIENGELDRVDPKAVVLLIGTNNLGAPADFAIKGDLKIISEIHQKLPNAKLLIMAIFPRGSDPNDPKTIDYRKKIALVNAELAKLDDGSKTRCLDIRQDFLQPDGSISKEIMADGLHPTYAGYQIWARDIQPIVDEMMK